MVDFTNPITSKVFLKNFVEFAPVYANAQAAYTAWAAAMGYGFPGSDSVGLSNSYYPGFGGFSPNVPFGFNVPYDYPVDGGYMHEFVVGAGGLYFYASRPSDDDTTTRTYTQADVLEIGRAHV